MNIRKIIKYLITKPILIGASLIAIPVTIFVLYLLLEESWDVSLETAMGIKDIMWYEI